VSVSWIKSTQFDWSDKRWNDGSLLYNQQSGDTHYLDPISMQITGLLASVPLNVDEIRAALKSRHDEASEMFSNDFILSTLIASLERIGLIEVSS